MYVDALSSEYKVKYTWCAQASGITVPSVLDGWSCVWGNKIISCLSSHVENLLILWEYASSLLLQEEPFSLALIIHYIK